MRIFWASDAVWHTTGYGVTTDYILKRAAQDGHEVINYAPGAMHQGIAELAPNLKVASSNFGDDRWGNHTLMQALLTFNPDLIVTWLDCQGLDSYGWTNVPVYMWAPIDTWPVPKHEVSNLNRARKILVPSKWGQDVLKKQDINSEYVPCGIDLDLYDIDPEMRASWRSQLRPEINEDTFLIGSVGLNTGSPDRKGYSFEFDAIKRFSEKHKDIRVYIHTNATGDGGAINLEELREEMGLEDVICFCRPQGAYTESPKYLRGMYNAFDVLLHCGMCEGFGMPLVEAQACGTPVIANDCTSMGELLGPLCYKSAPMADMIVSTNTRIALPSVDNLVEQLELAYDDWRQRRIDRKAVRENVLRYDQATLYEEHWRPLFEENLVPSWFGNPGPRKLCLAAGSMVREGFVHHDRELLLPHHDIAHDLNIFPWPWEDNSWDYIEFTDCIEHLRANIVEVMDELWRILAPDGHVFIHTAEANSWQLQLDPTHVQGFRLDSFDYFDPETRHGAFYSYTKRKWKMDLKTIDSAGLLFVMSPRKEAVEKELVPAGVEEEKPFNYGDIFEW